MQGTSAKLGAKKRLVGVSIFSFIFVIVGIITLLSLILASVLFLEVWVNFGHFYNRLDIKIDEFRQEAYKIADIEKNQEYIKAIDRLEHNLENFKHKFLFQNFRLSLIHLAFFLAFFCAFLYILTGLATFRLHRFARKLVFTTPCFGLATNLYIVFVVVYMFQSMQGILRDSFYLASDGSLLEVPPLTMGYFSLPDFVKIPIIIYFAIQFIFMLIVFYFFTRPKVKRAFGERNPEFVEG